MLVIKGINYALRGLKSIAFQIVLIFLLVLIWTSFETLLLYALKLIIDDIEGLDSIHSLWSNYLGIFAITVFFIEAPMRLASYIHANALPKTALVLRGIFTDKLLNKGLVFFDNKRIGNLVSRIAELPQATENIIKILLYGVISGSFGFFITVLLVALNLGLLALYFLIWYILMMIIGVCFIKQTIIISQNYAQEVNTANAELTGLLQNIVSVKMANKEGSESNRIKQFFQTVAKYQTQLEMLSFKADTLRSIISGGLFIGLFAFVLAHVYKGEASIGDLVFVMSSACLVRRDIWRVSLQLTEVYRYFGFIKEIEIIATPDEEKNLRVTEKRLTNIKSIRFHSICFKFNKDTSILQGVDFEIKKGMKVALVGASGAGKTTLIKLIHGIYTPYKGQIFLNDVSQDSFSASSIVENIAYVSQEPILFNRSIRDNITYLNSDADDKYIERIAKVTLCDEFINKLPHKYDTILNNSGNELSAGQKQRIAVARALCSKAKWIILDEPSSALDAKTEAKLIKNLLTYCRNRTLIIITHNLEIIQEMDKILLLENGLIAADGGHAELKKKSKSYKTFIKWVHNG
ncbi:MAG: putative transporter ATP-binding protein [Candidatus Midichloriaceae bacterium]|jgi:ABC-type bacteriocin/lantibiotic exporter with double-glycine peptidase domain|nr:putative transporter ATP-binding protein [Candidatus Midichloriaceae bacterium]